MYYTRVRCTYVYLLRMVGTYGLVRYPTLVGHEVKGGGGQQNVFLFCRKGGKTDMTGDISQLSS